MTILNVQQVDAKLLANDNVPVETVAVDELLGLLMLQKTVWRVWEQRLAVWASKQRG